MLPPVATVAPRKPSAFTTVTIGSSSGGSPPPNRRLRFPEPSASSLESPFFMPSGRGGSAAVQSSPHELQPSPSASASFTSSSGVASNASRSSTSSSSCAFILGLMNSRSNSRQRRRNSRASGVLHHPHHDAVAVSGDDDMSRVNTHPVEGTDAQSRHRRIDRSMLADVEVEGRLSIKAAEQDAYRQYLIPYYALMMALQRQQLQREREEVEEREREALIAAAAVVPATRNSPSLPVSRRVSLANAGYGGDGGIDTDHHHRGYERFQPVRFNGGGNTAAAAAAAVVSIGSSPWSQASLMSDDHTETITSGDTTTTANSTTTNGIINVYGVPSLLQQQQPPPPSRGLVPLPHHHQHHNHQQEQYQPLSRRSLFTNERMPVEVVVVTSSAPPSHTRPLATVPSPAVSAGEAYRTSPQQQEDQHQRQQQALDYVHPRHPRPHPQPQPSYTSGASAMHALLAGSDGLSHLQAGESVSRARLAASESYGVMRLREECRAAAASPSTGAAASGSAHWQYIACSPRRGGATGSKNK